MTLEIAQFILIVVLLIWNIYSEKQSKKLLNKHIDHIKEQEEYVKSLEKSLENIFKILKK